MRWYPISALASVTQWNRALMVRLALAHLTIESVSVSVPDPILTMESYHETAKNSWYYRGFQPILPDLKADTEPMPADGKVGIGYPILLVTDSKIDIRNPMHRFPMPILPSNRRHIGFGRSPNVPGLQPNRVRGRSTAIGD